MAVGQVVLGVVALVSGLGLAVEPVGEHRDRNRFPPRGILVPVDGHKVHLVCTRQGKPTVLLEGPQTGLSAMWRPVQDAVARFARVCSYDRAGFGWSEPGPLPQTSGQISVELHSLLAGAGVRPPYVLVGASAGGLPIRVFAGRYPEEVAGIVLVDSSHPDQVSRLHLPSNPAAHFKGYEPFLPVMHRLGILRFGLYREQRPEALPSDAWEEVLYLREKTNSYRAVLREGEACMESANQARASSDFGARPLLVLTGSPGADAQWRAALNGRTSSGIGSAFFEFQANRTWTTAATAFSSTRRARSRMPSGTYGADQLNGNRADGLV